MNRCLADVIDLKTLFDIVKDHLYVFLYCKVYLMPDNFQCNLSC